jgi:glycosyltransferase involved in cell wall biosynthesis
VSSLRTFGPASWHVAPGVGAELLRSKWMPDVISIQNVWLGINWSVGRWARSRSIPYMVTIHGNLNQAALEFSAKKKRLARRIFFDSLLRGAKCLQALNEGEYLAIRRFGLPQPICILPNGAEFPSGGASKNRRSPKGEGDTRIVVYLGRLHPIKNIEGLIRAFHSASKVYSNSKLIIAGDGDERYKRHLMNLAKSGAGADIEFLGYVEGRRKSEVLDAADIFVLPSLSEGFAMAPLEAMAHQAAVLVTASCNFPEVETSGAGRVVECTTEAIRCGLEDLLSVDATELAAMGLRARDLVYARFTWESICKQLVDVYAWMRAEGSRPSCVRLD